MLPLHTEMMALMKRHCKYREIQLYKHRNQVLISRHVQFWLLPLKFKANRAEFHIDAIHDKFQNPILVHDTDQNLIFDATFRF